MPGTLFWRDITRQPDELRKTLAHTLGPGRPALDRAAAAVRDAPLVCLTGIGSSWHAGMAIQALFACGGRPVLLVDASELLHFGGPPPGCVLVVLSRSGRSVEIVALLDRAREAGARVVGITNTPDSPLGQAAEVTLLLEAAFDHNVSVSMYTALGLVGGLVAAESLGTLDDALGHALDRAFTQCADARADWQARIEATDWLDPSRPPVLLARGGSLASCHEARLLWEEAAKTPAVALTTGGFRHGPQEVVRPDTRLGLWLDARVLRDEDLAMAADLRREGARVMLIGERVPKDAADLVLPVPETPYGWQFTVDIAPAQVAAELHSHRTGGDCDEFRLCPYVIEKEGGLVGV